MFDLIVRNANLPDGRSGIDIGIQGGRIAAVERNLQPQAEEEIDAITRMNALGAKNFNSGIRAYYFSVGTVAWFVSGWLAVAASLVTILVLAHREFFSTAHRTAASAAVIAARHRPRQAPPES